MTCVIGIEHKGNVWLGGDSAATDGSLNRTIIKDPKVVLKGNVGIGLAGSPKVLDAIAHVVELPKQEGGDDRSFLVGTLIPSLRDQLKKLDCTVDHPEHGTCFEANLLLAYRGALYTVQANFQLIKAAAEYAAIGSGARVALGSLHATGKGNPKKRIVAALKAATEGNAGVAPPFVVIEVKGK